MCPDRVEEKVKFKKSTHIYICIVNLVPDSRITVPQELDKDQGQWVFHVGEKQGNRYWTSPPEQWYWTGPPDEGNIYWTILTWSWPQVLDQFTWSGQQILDQSNWLGQQILDQLTKSRRQILDWSTWWGQQILDHFYMIMATDIGPVHLIRATDIGPSQLIRATDIGPVQQIRATDIGPVH